MERNDITASWLEVNHYPLCLLQLLGQLLQGRAVSLPHVLDLGLVVFRLFVDGLLEFCDLLLALGPAGSESK